MFSRPVPLVILNTLVFGKLFFCSTVWAGTFKQNLQKLQLVQNFAARLVTNTKKVDQTSITPGVPVALSQVSAGSAECHTFV